jgi:hypothetical protein
MKVSTREVLAAAVLFVPLLTITVGTLWGSPGSTRFPTSSKAHAAPALAATRSGNGVLSQPGCAEASRGRPDR